MTVAPSAAVRAGGCGADRIVRPARSLVERVRRGLEQQLLRPAERLLQTRLGPTHSSRREYRDLVSSES